MTSSPLITLKSDIHSVIDPVIQALSSANLHMARSYDLQADRIALDNLTDSFWPSGYVNQSSEMGLDAFIPNILMTGAWFGSYLRKNDCGG